VPIVAGRPTGDPLSPPRTSREPAPASQPSLTLLVQVTMALLQLEDNIGRRLGDRHDPLLVSVRTGAKFCMPGIMETVLNIGL
jgi:phosphoenolpyruvate synthase/pyruvate phosphate dikinase